MKNEIEKDFTKELAVLVPKLDIDSLRDQNKAKVWDTRLLTLSVENGEFIHNADKIKSAVEKGMTVLKDNLKVTESLDDVIMYKDNVNVLFNWFEGTRKESTSKMDELKKELSAPEKLLNDMKPLLKEKEDELNEKVYAVRKDSIISMFDTSAFYIKDEHNIDVNLKVFDSFIELKKKNKTFDLNKSGKLSSAAIKQIEEEFNKYVDPLIESKKQAEIIAKEQSFLTKELSKIKTTGTNEELERSVKDLAEIDISIPQLYANISNAKSQVTSVIQIVNNSIESNKRFEKQTAQNNKDLSYISGFSEIDMDSTVIAYHEFNLELLEKYPDLDNMIPSNKEKVTNKISEIFDRIQELKSIELSKVAPVEKEVIEEHNDYFDDIIADVPHGTIKTFKLNIDSVDFIKSLSIQSDNQDDAKKEMISKITSYLDMIILEEI